MHGRDTAANPLADPTGSEDVEAGRVVQVLMAAAEALHVNGQATDDTVRVVSGLGRRLGFDGVLIPAWNRLELLTSKQGGPGEIEMRVAIPDKMRVDRASAGMKIVESLIAGTSEPGGATSRLAAVVRMPPPPLWAYVGAVAHALAPGPVVGPNQSCGDPKPWSRRSAGAWSAAAYLD